MLRLKRTIETNEGACMPEKQIKMSAGLIILVVTSQKHFTALTTCCLQKLGLVGMVGYPCICS